jgi:type IV secretion system protein VirB6
MMRELRKIITILLILVLGSCSPSPSDTLKAEGKSGIGASGSGCSTIADMFQIPPETKLARDFPMEGGGSSYMGPVEFILTFVEKKLDGTVEKIFDKMNEGGAIDTLIMGSFTLWVAIFSASLLMGLVRASQYEIVMMIVKVMAVMALATNYSLFSEVIKDVLEDGGKELSEIMAGIFSNNVQDLNFIDDVVSSLLSFDSIKLMQALMTKDIGVGWLYAGVYALFLYFFITALLKTVYLLVIAMLVRSFLFSLAPLFLGLIIFKQTRSFFDGWIKQVANFTIMPIILFTFMGFFYAIIEYYVGELGKTPEGAVPKEVCMGPDSLAPGMLNLPGTTQIGAPGDRVSGVDATPPLDLTAILSLVVIAFVLRQMVDWASGLSGSLTQAVTTFKPSAAPKALSNQLDRLSKKKSSGSTKRTSIG